MFLLNGTVIKTILHLSANLQLKPDDSLQRHISLLYGQKTEFKRPSGQSSRAKRNSQTGGESRSSHQTTQSLSPASVHPQLRTTQSLDSSLPEEAGWRLLTLKVIKIIKKTVGGFHNSSVKSYLHVRWSGATNISDTLAKTTCQSFRLGI